MDDEVTAVEQELERIQLPCVPTTLRASVLGKVHRELVAARWERRLARTAAALLVAGIALNLTVSWQGPAAGSRETVAATSPETIVRVASAVAEVTDAETGRILARNLAAMSGTTLSGRQVADIQATGRPSPAAPSLGKDG